MIRLLLLLCLCCSPAAAQDTDKLTHAEVQELVTGLEALIQHGGDIAGTEQTARQLHAMAEQDFGPDSREVLQVELVILAALQMQARHDELSELSRYALDRALKLLPSNDPLVFRFVSIYAFSLLAQGEGDDALGLLAEALSDGEARLPADDPALIEMRLMQAVVATKEGRYDLAEANYRRVDALLVDKTDDASKGMRVVALQGWAQLMAEAAPAEEAIPVIKTAIAALEEQWAGAKNPKMVPLRIAMLLILADQMILLNQRPEVEAMLRPELAEAARVYGTDNGNWADLATRLAAALGREGASPAMLDEARDLMAGAVRVMEQIYSPEITALLDARVNYAVVLTQTGDFPGAIGQIKAMAGNARAKDRAMFSFVLHSAQEQGVISADQAVELMLVLLQESQRSGAAGAQRLLAARLEAGNGPAAALLRQRSDAKGRLTSYQNQLASFASLALQERDAAVEAELRAGIKTSMAEVAEAERQIAETNPDLAAATGKLALPLAEIRRRLGADAALVLIDPPAYEGDAGLIIAVSQEAVDWHTYQVAGAEVTDAITRLRDGISLRLGVRAAAALDDATDVPTQGFDLTLAHWLYEQTLGQVRSVTDGKGLIYFDLRGEASALPPQLLVMSVPETEDMAKADWLIRHHAVAILPALSALPDTAATPGKPAETLLAFADPDFSTLTATAPTALRGGLSPLPETAAEAQDVALALGAGTGAVRLGLRASEKAFKTADLSGIGTLYFATHGLVSGDQVGAGALDEPALALTPGQGEDGFLTASEIAELHLDAGLVVMSACNTAAGDAPGAESLSGLAQSFLYAGARGLMVSHWPVESRSAVALMTDLFRARAAHPGRPLALAQQEAILAMIDAPAHPNWSHPAYWAPFVIVGSPE